MHWKRKLSLLFLPMFLNVSCANKLAVNRVTKCDLEIIVQNSQQFYACKDDIGQDVIDGFGLVSEVKKFGQEKFGLEDSTNYKFYSSGKSYSPIKRYYNLLISPKNVMPSEWDYDFLESKQEYRKDIKGPIKLASFEDDLIDERDFYSSKNDVHYREILNYNDSCDLTPEFVKESQARQIEVILHEDWHFNTAKWFAGLDNNLDEGSATFFGLFGAIEFARYAGGKESALYKSAVSSMESYKAYAIINNSLFEKISEVYSRDIPTEEKAKLRDEIIKKSGKSETNNARIAADYVYTKRFMTFYKLYEKYRSLDVVVKIMKKMPASESNTDAYLKKFLTD